MPYLCQQNTFNLDFYFILFFSTASEFTLLLVKSSSAFSPFSLWQVLSGKDLRSAFSTRFHSNKCILYQKYRHTMVFMQIKPFTDSRVNIWNLCSSGFCCTTHEESHMAHQCWTKLGIGGTENNNRISQIYARLSSKCPCEANADHHLLSCRAALYRFMS